MVKSLIFQLEYRGFQHHSTKFVLINWVVLISPAQLECNIKLGKSMPTQWFANEILVVKLKDHRFNH